MSILTIRGARRLEQVDPEPTAALSVAEPIGGQHALNALYESKGTAVQASEEEIWRAVRLTGSRGFAIEPASAVAVACAIRAGDLGGETRVVIASGAAVKWGDVVMRDFIPPPVLPPDFEDVRLLGGGVHGNR